MKNFTIAATIFFIVKILLFSGCEKTEYPDYAIQKDIELSDDDMENNKKR